MKTGKEKPMSKDKVILIIRQNHNNHKNCNSKQGQTVLKKVTERKTYKERKKHTKRQRDTESY